MVWITVCCVLVSTISAKKVQGVLVDGETVAGRLGISVGLLTGVVVMVLTAVVGVRNIGCTSAIVGGAEIGGAAAVAVTDICLDNVVKVSASCLSERMSSSSDTSASLFVRLVSLAVLLEILRPLVSVRAF
jgi:hypothetical protein